MASHSSTSSFSEQKIFFKKLLTFIVLLFILDQALGRQLEHVFYNLRSGRFGDINRAVNTRADILILGASKAHHNYYPEVITEDLNVTCFNLGADGTNIIYHYALLNHIIKYYKPKLIIYDIGGKEFNKNYIGAEFFSILMPYIRNCNNVLDIVEKEDRYIYLKLFSRLYPFNQNLHSLILHGLIAPEENDAKNGYAPLYGSQLKKELQNKKAAVSSSVSSKAIEDDRLKFTFKAFLDLLAEQKIPALFINSPVWDVSNYYKQYNYPENISNMVKGYAVKLIIIQKDKYPKFNYELLFKDSSHLNHRGTMFFSYIVKDYLHQLMKNNYF